MIYWENFWDILWDILVKNCWVYLSLLGDIVVHWIYQEKLRNVLVKIMGYKTQKLCDILWGIFDKKRRGYICKTMGFIQKDYGI